MQPEIIHSSSFAADAASFIANQAREILGGQETFRIALCGGNTPRPVFERLASITQDLPWQRVLITFGDERTVPPEHEQSNFRMARESLLDHVPIPQGNVFRMRGELPPVEAAEEYEEQLTQIARRMGESIYIHDLLLLGIGDDGHTASLFPGTQALAEEKRSVIANHVPALDTDRITFSFPLINAARHVCFLVKDASKAGIVDEVVAGKSEYPSARVCPSSGQLTWLLGW